MNRAVWLALVDAGRHRQAIDTYFVRRDAVGRQAMARELARVPARRIVSRSIESWTGHGEGDTLRMMPGGYFSLTFHTTLASSESSSDEVRLVPVGDGAWRVVGYVRSP